MYKNFYHLTTEPFSTHPATDTFFISSTHKEAWYYLLFGIDTQEPFLVLTGEYGMGKTLLCLQLLKIAKEKGMGRIEYIPTTNEGYGGILRRMATNMGISPLPENDEILQDMIYDRFRAEEKRSRFYLIIDDAHELDTTTLTKLKYLSTFSYNEYFPVVMIFVAHPSFLQDLKTSALSSLNQRIKRRYQLSKFNLDDTKNYIYYRLLKSGATGIPSFPEETIQKIYEYSEGVPRLINNICDTCLLIGASSHMISIPPAIVDDAKKLVEGSLAIPEEKKEKENTSEETLSNNDIYLDNLSKGEADKQEDNTKHIASDEYEPDTYNSKATVSGKGLKSAVKIILVVILLLVFVALLTKLLIKDSNIFPLFSSKSVTTSQSQNIQSDKKDVKTNILRDELPGVPSDQTKFPATKTESNLSAPKDAMLNK